MKILTPEDFYALISGYTQRQLKLRFFMRRPLACPILTLG